MGAGMTIDDVYKMMCLVCDRVIEAKPLLTRLDSRIGDGDHGIGMRRGMTEAKKRLQEKTSFNSVNEIFRIVGRAMISSMGGSSGVVFGTWFLGASRACGPVSELTGPVFVLMMDHALEEIQKRGKARPGDKTMVDALTPAVLSMKDGLASDSGTGLPELFRLAALAAKEGAEATKDMIARHGHAKTLGERALGHPDPGAVSVAIIFEAMYELG